MLIALAGAGATAAPAITVDGIGFFQDRKQQATLELLLRQGDVLDASTIEDAAMIVFSGLIAEGFLEPEIEVEIRLPDDRVLSGPDGRNRFVLGPRLDRPLPRPLRAKSARLNVKPGKRFTLETVAFEGLAVVEEDDARAFFRPEYALWGFGRERAYSPARLDRSIGNLLEEFRRLGYAQAEVIADDPDISHETGHVGVRVRVRPGALWRVSSIDYSVEGGAELPDLALPVGQPWSNPWRQDFESAVRRWYFERGRPDVVVRLIANPSIPIDGIMDIAVRAEISPGPAVTLGDVRFEGQQRTRESVLRPLVRLDPGDPLDPSVLENGQFAISRLGVFNSVELSFEPTPGRPDTRDAVYTLREGKRSEASVLVGYGSYEEFRGGFEMRHYNLWGRAHSDRFEGVQSMKSSRGQYSYTIPELFGGRLDATAKLFGLRRHEPSFLRKEYGANFSVAWPVEKLGLDLTAGYTFKRLFSEEDTSLAVRDSGRANSASLEFGLSRDRRDNPLSPRRGYKVYANVEQASRRLGGQVDYQRLQTGFSYHTNWGRTRWVHVGVTHGLVTTFGAPDDRELPVNVRFFPGGENSIRGFREGQAAPRADDGRFIGAKSMLLLNSELEQALTPKLSAILFFDAIGIASRLDRYPVDEHLYSLGLGLRYQTLIGPFRLEYGRNVKKRALDPGGTFLFSLGFPF